MTTPRPISSGRAPRFRLRVLGLDTPTVILVDPTGVEFDMSDQVTVVSASITAEGSTAHLALTAPLEWWEFAVDTLVVDDGSERPSRLTYEELKDTMLSGDFSSEPAYDRVWRLLQRTGAVPSTEG